MLAGRGYVPPSAVRGKGSGFRVLRLIGVLSGLYRGCMGLLENKVETTIRGCSTVRGKGVLMGCIVIS